MDRGATWSVECCSGEPNSEKSPGAGKLVFTILAQSSAWRSRAAALVIDVVICLRAAIQAEGWGNRSQVCLQGFS